MLSQLQDKYFWPSRRSVRKTVLGRLGRYEEAGLPSSAPGLDRLPTASERSSERFWTWPRLRNKSWSRRILSATILSSSLRELTC